MQQVLEKLKMIVVLSQAPVTKSQHLAHVEIQEATNLHQLMQELQLFPLKLQQVELAVLLIPQIGNILTFICKLCKVCYHLCVNQYKVLSYCVSMHLLEHQCLIQACKHRHLLSLYKQYKLEFWDVDLATHLLEKGTSLRQLLYLKDVLVDVTNAMDYTYLTDETQHFTKAV